MRNSSFTTKTGTLAKKKFQTGIIVSVKATLALYDELKSEELDFFMTSRVNQDALENVFSQLRLIGGSNTHPTAVECTNRIRNLCLLKHVNPVVSNPNVEMTDQDSFISAELFSGQGEAFLDDPDVDEDDVVDVEVPENEDEDEDNDEVLTYVAGYIGRKLGYRPNEPQNPTSWIAIKGHGHLFEPSSDLRNICKGCNTIFNQFHGKELTFCLDPVKKVEDKILDQNPTYPPRVVKLFCKIKVFNRIKRLNCKLKESKGSKSARSLKQTAQFLF